MLLRSAFSDFQIFREVNVDLRTELEQTYCLNIITVWNFWPEIDLAV